MPRPILKLSHDAEAIFQSRPNRFLGIVDIPEQSKTPPRSEQVHIHDPGRLEELLYTGNRVLIKRAGNTKRKTRWDTLSAYIDDQWVLIHSGYHRTITENILSDPQLSPFGKVNKITPEVTIGHSRLDFCLTQENGSEIYVEVKGCTLAVDGVALFPDAPTERGARHVQTLMDLKQSGHDIALVILIFRRDAKCFAPNKRTDPYFAETLSTAIQDFDLKVYPIVLEYDGNIIYYNKIIPLCPNL